MKRQTRRGFIGSVFAAGAGMAAGRVFAAAPEDYDENFAVFLSDVHVSGGGMSDPKRGVPDPLYPRDCFHRRPLPAAERNPAWDVQIAENRGQTCTFVF